MASAQETDCLVAAVADAGLLERDTADSWLQEIGEIRAMLIVLRRCVRADPRGRAEG